MKENSLIDGISLAGRGVVKVELSADDLERFARKVVENTIMEMRDKSGESTEVIARHELQKMLGLSRSTVLRLERKGVLRCIHMGKKAFYRKKDLEDYLALHPRPQALDGDRQDEPSPGAQKEDSFQDVDLLWNDLVNRC